MIDAPQEPTKESRVAEKKRFWIGVSLAILFLFSAANIFLLLFIIPKFELIYRDAPPSMHLPPLTEFMITARIAFAIIALGWPILGKVLIRLQKPYAILWINMGILCTFLQIGITFYALFRPMIGFHGGLGEGR